MEITAIWLRRVGAYHVIVEIEVAGKWIPVITDHVDGPFSHIVERSGIERAIRIANGQPSGDVACS